MGGLIDYTVSYLGQIIVIARSRPRSLTIEHLLKHDSLDSRTILNLRSHLESLTTYFIKWTTSGKPPVDFKSPQDSK